MHTDGLDENTNFEFSCFRFIYAAVGPVDFEFESTVPQNGTPSKFPRFNRWEKPVIQWLKGY